MRLSVAVEEVKENYAWASLLQNAQGATVFHSEWYLALLGVEYLLTVRLGGKMVAGLPIFSSSDERVSVQSGLLVPYGGPVFRAAHSDSRQQMLFARTLTVALIEVINEKFDHMQFAMSPDIIDCVAFIQAGYVPELRYTYRYPVTRNSSLSKGRKNDLARARRAGLTMHEDRAINHFDINAAVSWSRDEQYERFTRRLLSHAIECGCGKVCVAMAGDEVVAGLFYLWDRRYAYTTHAYRTEQGAAWGASTALYMEAIKDTRDNSSLMEVDFEGSVLPGVERFYQSFGAVQTPYITLHWHANPAERQGAELYRYE